MTVPASTRPLTDLLGESRARIVTVLQREATTATRLAAALDISAAAVRRHLAALVDDKLIVSTTRHDGGMGRPSEIWSLTPRGKQLFADRSAEFADELLDHVEATYGRRAVADFLKARNERKADALVDQLDDTDDPGTRADVLADVLSRDGFAARVERAEDGRSLTLVQTHCAIEGIAREHPEVCAHEAALFRKVLGTSVSRRQTIASGAAACVCRVDLT